MSGTVPRLSIGVPVYNGQDFLRATLDSILAQTYTDFELILCDNASTDLTAEICREYVQRDPRVRYFRNSRNIGPAPNYNRCFAESRGELFKWCAADDVLAPTFVEKCIAMLDADPLMVAAYPRTLLIDEQGVVLQKYDWDLDLTHRSPAVRFARLVFVNHRYHNAHEFWSVVRSDIMRRTAMKGSFPSGDRILMSWWTLMGKMGQVQEYLFLNREHRQRSQCAIPNRNFRPGSRLSRIVGGGPAPPYEWWDASKKGRVVFPEWRWVWEYLRAVRKTPLPLATRLACYAAMAGLYGKFAPRLARDLLIALELTLYRWFRLIPRPAPTRTRRDPSHLAQSHRRAA
jgi:glycosyltransferase involved in cell wall biosynthesis